MLCKTVPFAQLKISDKEFIIPSKSVIIIILPVTYFTYICTFLTQAYAWAIC